MKLNEAVAARILEYCNNRNITVNKLCTMSGVIQSTVNSIFSGRSQNPKLQTTAYLCEGLSFLFRSFSTAPCFQISTISILKILTFPPPWDYNFPEVIL